MHAGAYMQRSEDSLQELGSLGFLFQKEGFGSWTQDVGLCISAFSLWTISLALLVVFYWGSGLYELYISMNF